MFDSSAALESWTISNRCRRFYDFLDDRHVWSIFANDILQTKEKGGLSTVFFGVWIYIDAAFSWCEYMEIMLRDSEPLRSAVGCWETSHVRQATLSHSWGPPLRSVYKRCTQRAWTMAWPKLTPCTGPVNLGARHAMTCRKRIFAACFGNDCGKNQTDLNLEAITSWCCPVSFCASLFEDVWRCARRDITNTQPAPQQTGLEDGRGPVHS